AKSRAQTQPQQRVFGGQSMSLFARVLSAALLSLWLVVAFAFPAVATTPAELETINQQWQTSVHALNGVNCASCHQTEETKAFITQPTYESCQSCHENPVETFLLGKHGVRLLEGESPLQPKMARLPMKHDAFNQQMNCNTCHNAHTVNTLQASVDSCLTCHNDTHSLNYENSKHGKAVFAAIAANPTLPRPSDEMVTCATCHLPRTAQKKGDGTLLVKVNHNNTYTLKPRDRMVGDVCMNCHGMEYSYNSIFDDALVKADFDRPPTLEHPSFKLVRAAEDKRSGNSSAAEE
ncbi:MAG: cytochrome c3 family protein, partial [Phormidesmis sp.]